MAIAAHAVLNRLACLASAIAMLGVVHAVGIADGTDAQRVPVLGYVANENADTKRIDAFKKGLADLGYVEGKNFRIEYRSAKLDSEYLAVTSELLARKVDIVLVGNAPAAVAAAKATRTTPIVLLAVNDPVGLGAVDSLERPGRNVTGTTIYAPHLIAERVRILKNLVPTLDHAAVFLNGNNANNRSQLALLNAAATDLGIRIDAVDIRTETDVKLGLDKAIGSGAQAFFNCVDSFINSQRFTIAALMGEKKLPMIYTDREYVLAGGLMALGVGHLEGFYGAAVYVDRILHGANPADLPIAPPSELEFSVSRAAMRNLGITLPEPISERVTEWLS